LSSPVFYLGVPALVLALGASYFVMELPGSEAVADRLDGWWLDWHDRGGWRGIVAGTWIVVTVPIRMVAVILGMTLTLVVLPGLVVFGVWVLWDVLIG
jgi:hypothetical protein